MDMWHTSVSREEKRRRGFNFKEAIPFLSVLNALLSFLLFFGRYLSYPLLPCTVTMGCWAKNH